MKLLLTVIAIFLSVNACLFAQHADLIFVNGSIWTVDEKNPTVQAVAMKDGKFIAVGKNTEILKLRGKPQGGTQTEVIDLRGRFAMPGFNDNHVHFASAAQFLEFNIMAVGTQEEFVQRIRQVIAKLPKGEWIVGGFWGAYDQWAAGAAGAGTAGGSKRKAFTPDMKRIESLTKEYPMFIRKFDDSEFAANTAALRAAGLDSANPQAPDVEFVANAKGAFSGIMRGKGVLPLFRNILPRRFSHERRVQQTKRALEEIRKFGVTNVSDMSDDEQLEIYRELHAAGELTCRIHFRYGLERWKELADKGVKAGSGDEWIRLGSLKGHIDGIMGTSSARFFEPYSNNPENRGRWRPLMVDSLGNFVEGKFLGYMLDADRAGL